LSRARRYSGREITSVNNPEHIRILVVNHDRWTRHSVTAMLCETGFGVREASNGMSALRLAASLPPHVVLIGDGLPEISTRDVVSTLRANPRTRHAAVVRLRDSPAAATSEVDGAIDLPCNSIELLATVIAALEARHTTEVAARRLSPSGGAAFGRQSAGVAEVRRARFLETGRARDADRPD
jgi:DNA-binding response OmpR family regulator